MQAVEKIVFSTRDAPIQRSLQLSASQIRDALRALRKWGIAFPQFTRHYGEHLLNTASRLYLGDERWSIIEQVFLACLDQHDLVAADALVNQLHHQFPTSRRVARLVALQLEVSQGPRSTAVEEAYTQLLDKDETDEAALKREVTLHKSAGNLPQAIEALVGYLGCFMADVEAWRELACLYMSLLKFRQAAFCVEELMLSSPENFHYATLHADLLFSQGGLDNLLNARSYYLNSLHQHSSRRNLRALLGLYATCQAIGATPIKKGSDVSYSKEENATLLSRTTVKLNELYSQFQPAYLVPDASLNFLLLDKPLGLHEKKDQ